MLPTLEAITCRAMYAFGNHLHVSSGEEHLTTRDSGVFTHTTRNFVFCNQSLCNWHATSCHLQLSW